MAFIHLSRLVFVCFALAHGSGCQLPQTPGSPAPITHTPSLLAVQVSFDGGASSQDVQLLPPPDAAGDARDGAVLVLPSRVHLQPFANEQNFRAYADLLIHATHAREEAQRHPVPVQVDDKPTAYIPQLGAQSMDGGTRAGTAHRSRAIEAPTPSASAPTTATSPDPSSGSITNNQEQGVDEGDIVKVRANDLIILRRGRLFSVRLQEGRLRARSVISAAPPGVTPASWYDEMLVDGDTILVTGYGYQRRATEINRFHIDADAVITYRDTILLRSGDYYSSRNYASRIVNHKLVLYSPVPLFQNEYDPDNRTVRQTVNIPAWKTLDGRWQSSANWLEIYRPMRRMGYAPTLHTVNTCDLATSPMRCTARAVLAGNSRSFYVSRSAIYLWVASSPHEPDLFAQTHQAMYQSVDPTNSGSIVYRFPLGDQAVGAVITTGSPVDQFSFRETAEKLQVTVMGGAQGDAMWGPENSRGAMGLYQLPVTLFSSEVPYAEASMLRHLPSLELPYMIQNRFVGDYLLYGSGNSWRRRSPSQTVTHRVLAHNIARTVNQAIETEHTIDRIEPMMNDAVIVGTDTHNNLHFSALALGTTAERRGHFVRENAAQGETRSHGFFYLPGGEHGGMLGLPLRSGGAQGWRQLREGSAEVLFLRVTDLNFNLLGSLVAHPPTVPTSDNCVASCADWYGNARPIFYRSRIYALMGYELVEGALTGPLLTERSRMNYLEALRPFLNRR